MPRYECGGTHARESAQPHRVIDSTPTAGVGAEVRARVRERHTVPSAGPAQGGVLRGVRSVAVLP
eukprot:6396103-Prymnesium_polylepis.1